MGDKEKKLCEFIANYFRIDENHLYGHSRKEDIVMARHLAWYILHADYKVPVSILSKEFFRAKRVVFFGINKIKTGISNQRFYRVVYEKFMESYKNKHGRNI